MPQTPTTPGKTPRQARKKVTTDLGRQLLTRERQRLAREQAAVAERLTKDADARRQQQKINGRKAEPLNIGISRGIVKRFTAVLASEGVRVRITATPSHQTSAWTDFEQIVINYAPHADERLLAATLRGLAYHEGGHCRFTLPFLQLAEAAGENPDTNAIAVAQLHRAWNCLEDQRMETAVVSDSPRKAAYLTPMIMTEFVDTLSHAAANWPLLIWRRYLPRNIRKGARKLFVTFHNERGVDGAALAHALEVTTTKYVMADNAVTMWEAVVEYAILLQGVTLAADVGDRAMGHERQYRAPKRNLDDFLIIPVNGGEEGEEDDDEDESDTVETAEQFEHFLNIWWSLINGQEIGPPILHVNTGQSEGEGEGQGTPSEADDSDTEGGEGEGDDEGDEGGEGGEGEGSNGSNDDEGDDDAEGDSNGSNGSNDDDTDGDDPTATGGDDDGMEFADDGDNDADDEGGSTGEHKNSGLRDDLDYKPETDTELSEDDLRQAIEDAEAERDADTALNQDVQALHDAINSQTSDLPPYNAGISSDTEAQAAADNLAEDIRQAFEENTIEKAPGWVEQQRRGFVNVLRYETRRPGDVEFFRSYTDTDAPGHNIAVSVLLDYSGSMGASTKGLAQAGYATKVACDSLGIPCTVVLWDTGATVLYDADERAEYLPVIVSAGGTDPSVALADLDNQRFDKDMHIVLIMTDGSWGGSCATPGFLAAYKGENEGRYFIGLGYSSNSYDSGPANQMAENLRRYGCDEAHGIGNLMDIPRYVEQSLIAFS